MAYPPLGLALIIVSVVFPILALVMIVLRVVARSRADKRVDLSDWFLFFAMFITIVNSVTCIVGAVIDAMGSPLESLTPAQQTGFMKVLFVTQFFYVFSVFSVKVAILLFYKTIFVIDTFRKVSNVLLVVLGAWAITFFFATLFQDKPISRNWGTNGTTIDFPVFYSMESLTNLILDLMILCMPLFVIRTLHMSTKKKWLLGGIFWLGAFCVVSTTVRLGYFIFLIRAYGGRADDFAAMTIKTVIWGEIEPCTSIIAACLPTLAPLFRGGGGGSGSLSRKSQHAKSPPMGTSLVKKPNPVRVLDMHHRVPSADNIFQTGNNSDGDGVDMSIDLEGSRHMF